MLSQVPQNMTVAVMEIEGYGHGGTCCSQSALGADSGVHELSLSLLRCLMTRYMHQPLA